MANCHNMLLLEKGLTTRKSKLESKRAWSNLQLSKQLKSGYVLSQHGII